LYKSNAKHIEIMTLKKEIEVTIGECIYNFTVKFHFHPGKSSQDPTEGSDTVLESWDIITPVYGYHTETEEEWKVIEDDEYDMVMDWVDFQNEFDTI
jgi:hypothetical protein